MENRLTQNTGLLRGAGHVAKNKLEAREAASDPNRSVLRSALTGSEIALIDDQLEPVILRRGDKVLLASDGIDTIDKGDIAEILSLEVSAQDIASKLIEKVLLKDKPRQDNTTVIVIDPSRLGWPLGAKRFKSGAGREAKPQRRSIAAQILQFFRDITKK